MSRRQERMSNNFYPKPRKTSTITYPKPQKHQTRNPLPIQAKLLAPTQLRNSLPIQKISQTQMTDRRVKDLRYFYDSKWNLGHNCQNPILYLIEKIFEVPNDKEGGSVMDRGEELATLPINLHDTKEFPMISLHAIMG